MTNTWLPFAIRRPGPSWKQGYPGVGERALGEIEGEVKHSAEGSLAAAFGVLDGERQASWHFTLAKDGRIFQHYSVEAITWHAGLPGDRRQDTSLIGNLTLVGEEHEGGGPNTPGEPLTEPQYQATLRLSQELRRLASRVGATGPALRRDLWEHRWLVATSCPSGRIPWSRLISDLAPAPPAEEDSMASAEYGELKQEQDRIKAVMAQRLEWQELSAACGRVAASNKVGSYPLDEDIKQAQLKVRQLLKGIGFDPAEPA